VGLCTHALVIHPDSFSCPPLCYTFLSMFRLKSLTKNAVALPLAFTVLWSLLGCASLCTLESTLHESERSACGGAGADDRAGSVDSTEDCGLCPDITSPAGTTQQRETGEQLVSLYAATPRLVLDLETALVFSYQTSKLPDDSPPKINEPPLFLRLRTIRI
jgi:hypothetical protein